MSTVIKGCFFLLLVVWSSGTLPGISNSITWDFADLALSTFFDPYS